MPPMPSSPFSGGQAPELPTEKEMGEEKKKKKDVAMMLCKARPGEPSDDCDEEKTLSLTRGSSEI